jgi:phage-related protein (TIGR01555 family)
MKLSLPWRTDAKPKPLRAERADVWQSPATRYGIPGKDKTIGASFVAELIDQETALEIWRGGALGGRIVELIPQEMTREGWDINIEQDKEKSEAVDAAGRDLNIEQLMYLGLCFGRCLGGGGALMLVDDGASDLEVPLRENNIRSFLGLNLLTPRELIPARWYSDPTQPKYGEVAVYYLRPVNAPPGAPLTNLPLVHESRVLRFAGTMTTLAARLGRGPHLGWDDSIFTRIYQPLMDFENSMRGATILMQDFAPAVFKALKLAELLSAAKQRGSALNIADRLNGMEFGSSNARVKVIDEKEEYKRESVSVAGLPELLERSMLNLAAAAGMPVSLLMGQAPSGLNATGDSDIRWFYDHVAAFQVKHLRPLLARFYKLLMLSKDGPTKGNLPENWDVCFRPLWQMTPPEIAKMRADIATADAAMVAAGVLMPEEVAQRWAGDTYSTDIRIDLAERQKLMEAQAERESAATVAGREADPEGPEAAQAKAAHATANAPPKSPKDPENK